MRCLFGRQRGLNRKGAAPLAALGRAYRRLDTAPRTLAVILPAGSLLVHHLGKERLNEVAEATAAVAVGHQDVR
jgi:hypothetical protein